MTAIPSLTAFHRHLDTCQQCRCQPFNLCDVGHSLLTGAVNEPHPPHRQCGCTDCLPSFDDDAVPPMARAPEIMDGVE